MHPLWMILELFSLCSFSTNWWKNVLQDKNPSFRVAILLNYPIL